MQNKGEKSGLGERRGGGRKGKKKRGEEGRNNGKRGGKGKSRVRGGGQGGRRRTNEEKCEEMSGAARFLKNLIACQRCGAE